MKSDQRALLTLLRSTHTSSSPSSRWRPRVYGAVHVVWEWGSGKGDGVWDLTPPGSRNDSEITASIVGGQKLKI